MADTRPNIQTFARVYADDNSLLLTAGEGKVLFDEVYLGFFNPTYKLLGRSIGRRWPERTQEDTSLTMVVGDEDTYIWPASKVFKEPFWIEGLDSNSEPYPISPAPDMATWSLYDQTGNGTPLYWRLMDINGRLHLALRPKPSQTNTIRITGLIGVRKWPATATSTVDQNVAAAERTLYVAATTAFQVGDHVIVGEGTAREEKASVSSITAADYLLTNAALTYAHTAAQADVVELTTPFRDDVHDMALAKFTAAAYKAKRGDTGRGLELVEEGLGLLPQNDTAPVLTGGSRIQPWGGRGLRPWRW